jgi:hypothetical protein
MIGMRYQEATMVMFGSGIWKPANACMYSKGTLVT